MTGKPAPPITRRNFLQLMTAAGAGLLATGLLRASNILPELAKTSTVSRPPGIDRIKNIVFFIQENHSFDSLFGDFPGANGKHAKQDCPDSMKKDPPHRHLDSVQGDSATSEEANCTYEEADVPNYWKLARGFTLCDNYFSEVRGPSHPNFLMMISGQSPIIDTPLPTDVCPDFCLDLEVLPNRLDARGLSWRDYGGIFTSIQSLIGRPEVMDFRDEQFFLDAADGTLPNISWLNSGFLSDALAKSGHPPSSMCVGENYAVTVLNAIMSGPQWSTTALFLVWDEWGGFYDHVNPSMLERWKDGTPFRYGYRVPCIVVSPFARSGHISYTLHSHVSLLRFAETVFGLAPLTERDATASNLLDCFDFTQPPLNPLFLEKRECPP